jgi:hypothetical protein
MTKNKLLGLLLGGAVVLLTASATAGWKTTASSAHGNCNAGTGCYGSGAFGPTRASNNNVDEMDCWSTATSAGCMVYGATNYIDAACTTTDPNIMAIIRSLNNDAYIYFSSDTTGTCTSFTAYNDSGYMPKTP